MMDMPYKNDSFDCILCRNVISHTDTEGIYAIINKIYNLLKYALLYTFSKLKSI